VNLNGKQIISIIGAIVSVLMVSTTQLTDLFGPGVTKTVVSIAGLSNMILSSVMAALTSQGSTVKDVLAMPGVEHVTVNAQATQTLAALAVDPAQDKIAPMAHTTEQITAIAKGP
jgi:hypothetical protein